MLKQSMKHLRKNMGKHLDCADFRENGIDIYGLVSAILL